MNRYKKIAEKIYWKFYYSIVIPMSLMDFTCCWKLLSNFTKWEQVDDTWS